MRRTFTLFALFLVSVPVIGIAETGGTRQSFETCSMITSEYITVLQLISQGFTEEQLLLSLPGLSAGGKKRVHALVKAANEEGLAETFSAVNSEYARCSQAVFDQRGAPEPVTREGHFYFCAGENKLRYEILMAASVDAPRDEILAQVPERRQRVAKAIFDLNGEEGILVAFDAIGDELKYCLNGQG